MYNIDFLPQLEKSKRFIFGMACSDGKSVEESAMEYVPPANLEVIGCYEDVNGEWVPRPARCVSSKIEKKVS